MVHRRLIFLRKEESISAPLKFCVTKGMNQEVAAFVGGENH